MLVNGQPAQGRPFSKWAGPAAAQYDSGGIRTPNRDFGHCARIVHEQINFPYTNMSVYWSRVCADNAVDWFKWRMPI
ncbi:hypothetical protein [Pandoravirus japonicus]|uniref:Uncharacterized protein n=1 Tax=Pandoravirus japonicus TaxID=2823154 RepID=A0A811BM96_9VIRU|nr:hypothetical protein [Pandoravirus japonicus]